MFNPILWVIGIIGAVLVLAGIDAIRNASRIRKVFEKTYE